MNYSLFIFALVFGQNMPILEVTEIPSKEECEKLAEEVITDPKIKDISVNLSMLCIEVKEGEEPLKQNLKALPSTNT